MRVNEEHIIIQRILDGDVHAFEEVVNSYKEMVFTISLRILQNREDAEEIAQDVFVKVFQSLKNFNMKSKLSTWIYRITYNTTINKLKSNNRSIATTEIDERTEFRSEAVPDALFELRNQEAHNAIMKSLYKLKESDRVIVTLYYFDELHVAEIAEVVGISVQNVKVKLHRSRLKLYTELSGKVDQEIIKYEYN